MTHLGQSCRSDTATSGSPILGSDTAGGCVIYSGASATAVSVPHPTTGSPNLSNPYPIFYTENKLTAGDITFTPAGGYTVNSFATLVEHHWQRCSWFLNPVGTDWDVKCFDAAWYVNGVVLPASAAVL